jgi:pantoate--beta-alanine ligase
MILFKKASDLRRHIHNKKTEGKLIGFIPTMGALHQGHLSLVESAKKQRRLTVCSIFINPTQFNDANDFRNYPLSIEQDIVLLEKTGTDILFWPGLDEIYPSGTSQLEQYDLGYLDSILEGRFRPGHFQGVCQVMSRLLNIVEPDSLFMGQKDFQQGMVIKALLKLIHSTTELVLCPTEREPEGLAMSSRNTRLNPAQRKKSVAIFEALLYLKKNLHPGALSPLIDQAFGILAKNDFSVDYLEIADLHSLELVRHWNGQKRLIGLVAAFQDDIRLIDNMVLDAEPN